MPHPQKTRARLVAFCVVWRVLALAVLDRERRTALDANRCPMIDQQVKLKT